MATQASARVKCACGGLIDLPASSCPLCGELLNNLPPAPSVTSNRQSVSAPPPPPRSMSSNPSIVSPVSPPDLPITSSVQIVAPVSSPHLPLLASEDADPDDLPEPPAPPPAVVAMGGGGPSLDVSEIVDLVQQHKAEYEQMESLAITLLLGETGAGKSTTVNFLAGRKFAERKVEVDLVHQGKVMKIPKTIIECVEPLENFVIGHTADAQTRFLRLLKTPNGLNLCDAPGFEDTNGPNVDISNAIAIANVLRRSRGVVILLLIKWTSLEHERGQGLKKIVELLARFIPSIVQNNFSSIQCAFSHVPQDRAFGDIASRIIEVQQAAYVQTHPILPRFLAWVLDAVMTHQDVLIIRPLSQDSSILHDLIKNSPPLQQLDDVTVPLAHNSSFALQQYCSQAASAMSSLHLGSIEAAQQNDVKRMLRNLKMLAEETRLPELARQWTHCETLIQRATADITAQLRDSLERRRFEDAMKALGTLEWIEELTGASLLGPITAFMGTFCQTYLMNFAAQTNISNFMFNFVETKILQENFGKIIPAEYKQIYERCVVTAQETAQRYRMRLEQLIKNDDFGRVATEFELLAQGVSNCQGYVDFTQMHQELIAYARGRIRSHVNTAQVFMKQWSYPYDQAPNLILDGENVAGLPLQVNKPLPPSPSSASLPVDKPASLSPSPSSNTLKSDPPVEIITDDTEFFKTAAPRIKQSAAIVPESKEDAKEGVVLLDAQYKKLSVDVNVGGAYGRKLEWSFAIPDGNKVHFSVVLKEQKPVTLCSMHSHASSGKYEVPEGGSRIVTFRWENKGALLKAPKPVQFVYAIKVWATSLPPGATAPPPPVRSAPGRPSNPHHQTQPQPQPHRGPPGGHAPPPPMDEKSERANWANVVSGELITPAPEGGHTLTIESQPVSLALNSLLSAAQCYAELQNLLGADTMEGVLLCNYFVENAKLRLLTMHNLRSDNNLVALSSEVWRACVISRFTGVNLRDLIAEYKSFYESLLKSSTQIFHHLLEECGKLPAKTLRACEDSARAWLLLKLQNQKDLIQLLRLARTAICERLSQFFNVIPNYSPKVLATQFIEHIAPFRLHYPVALTTLTTRLLQRFALQMSMIDQNLVSPASLQAMDDLYNAIVILHGSEWRADMKQASDDMVLSYDLLTNRMVDAVLGYMRVDPSLSDHEYSQRLGTSFLAYAHFCGLKGSCIPKRTQEVEFAYAACVQALTRLVMDPSQLQRLKLFMHWASARPEVFQRAVALIDLSAPDLRSEIVSAFPNRHTTAAELDKLRIPLQRLFFLVELCQNTSPKMNATLQVTKQELSARLFDLLDILRNSRPPPQSLTELLRACAMDVIICRQPFGREWEMWQNKWQTDSSQSQRAWKIYLESLYNCHRSGSVVDADRLFDKLNKPLFEVLQALWHANVPFTVADALTNLKDWWGQEIKSVCTRDDLVTLEEKNGVANLTIKKDALSNVHAFWRARSVLESTLTRLVGAGVVNGGAIEAFPSIELRQWFLEFLNKLSTAGMQAANALQLPVVNQLIQLIGELEALISANDEHKEHSYTNALLDSCRSRINLSRDLCKDETKTAMERCKLIVEVRNWSIAIDHVELTKFVKKAIAEILGSTGSTILAEMGPLLESHGEVGQRLVQEYETFHLERVRILNRETGGITFSTALEEMRRRNVEKKYHLDTAKLTSAWERYRGVNNDLMAKVVLDKTMKIEDVVAQARKLVSGGDIPTLLGHACAVLSALKSKGVTKPEDVTQPHATQMLALFVMLLDEAKEGHLVEVGTGEGKSIILGLLATILALQGFEVHVACYSRALVDRDKKSFVDVFEAFGVKDQVKYNTFAGLVSDVIARVGDIRSLTEALLIGRDEKIRARDKKQPLPRVLLIDEVDVFLHREVYGASNQPLLIMRSAAITEICNYIYNNQAGIRMQILQKLPVYQQLKKEFVQQAWPLLDSCLAQLLNDVKNINNAQFAYTVVKVAGRNVLGYQTLEGVDTETSWRGVTMFQCMKEHAKNIIDASVLKEVTGFYISCGAYSYAEIPKNYNRVIGVTGTYEQLGESEKRILREGYNIRRTTLTASMYGSRRDRLKQEDVRVFSNEDGQYLAIRDAVDRIRNHSVMQKLSIPPILIFFENDQVIRNFTQQSKNIAWISDLKGHFYVVKESCDNLEYAMTKSMLAGAVTAFPAIFGRGLDFRCFVPGIDDLDGVHVIQTFLSPEISEEVQIQGRTARQKHRGTFIQLMSETQLKKTFGIEPAAVNLARGAGPGRLYKFLDDSRQKWFSAKAGDRQTRVAQAESMHKETWKYLVQLTQASATPDFIINLNPAPPQPPMKQSRTLCLSDATGSMGSVWDGTKAMINEMLKRLDAMGCGDNFKLKWIAYRDYDCGPRVIESSPWSSEPTVISEWLATVQLIAGNDWPEAVEAGLHEVNAEPDAPTRVLLIGDAPPHEEKKGDTIVAQNNHVLATDYVLECQELAQKGIPIYAFWMGHSSTQTAFEHIASLTNGVAKQLAQASDLLDVIAENLLDDIGGADLVAEYYAKYKGKVS